MRQGGKDMEGNKDCCSTNKYDFNLSLYYRESRDMLIQESSKKEQQQIKVKKAESGCPAEDFRVKRLLDPVV